MTFYKLRAGALLQCDCRTHFATFNLGLSSAATVVCRQMRQSERRKKKGVDESGKCLKHMMAVEVVMVVVEECV